MSGIKKHTLGQTKKRGIYFSIIADVTFVLIATLVKVYLAAF